MESSASPSPYFENILCLNDTGLDAAEEISGCRLAADTSGSVRVATEDRNGSSDQCGIVPRNRSIREVFAVFQADPG